MSSLEKNRSVRARRQSGLSLIEMMIALVLGLIVVSAVLNVFVGSNRSAAFSNGLRAMQENGRHGIQVLQKGIRVAGYRPAGSIEPLNIAKSGPSAVSIRVAASFDCNGQSTATNAGIAENTYSFDSTNQQVTCTGSSATPTAMPLVDGVENFRVLYGLDVNGNGQADQYVPYSATLSAFDIRAVRMALLVSSVSPIRSRSVAQTHVVLDDETSTNDRIARNVFMTSVLLRNSR